MPNCAPCSTLVMPSPASVIAMPTTIWSSPSQTQSTIMNEQAITPPIAPSPNPSHDEWP